MSRRVVPWCRVAGIVVLATVVVAGVALAHASPPDPSWIAGLYDDADYDDVVLALLGVAGFLACITFSAEPIARIEALALADPPRPPRRHVEAPRSRAPPPPRPA